MINSLSRKRINWIDIAKGIAIVLMIIGHDVTFGGNVRNLIFSFHMPIFFLLTGYTIRPYNQIYKATFKDFKNLIIPVLIVKFVQAIAEIIIHHIPARKMFFDTCLQLIWGNGCSYKNFQVSV